MKDLSGTAAAEIQAPPSQVFSVLADVERYRDWYPDVIRRVEVLERRDDGGVALADATLRAPGIPVVGDLELRLRVELETGRAVTLTRVPNGPDDRERFTVAWTLDPVALGTRVTVRLDAALPLPRLVPVSGLGDRVAGGFVRAAARAIEPSAS